MHEAGSISPHGIQVLRGDVLRITAYSSLASRILRIVPRYFSGGRIVEGGGDQLTTDATRAANTKDIQLSDGTLISVLVYVASGGSLKRGQCYIKGEIIRGGSSTNKLQKLIIGNYVTSAIAISYPDTPVESSVNGEGFIREVQDTTLPISSFFVPTNARWRMLIFHATIVTSAVAANRILNLQFQSSLGYIHANVSSPVVQAASLTREYNIGDYSTSAAVGTNNDLYIRWPSVIMLDGDALHVELVNDQAGDTMNAYGQFMEWIEV